MWSHPITVWISLALKLECYRINILSDIFTSYFDFPCSVCTNTLKSIKLHLLQANCASTGAPGALSLTLMGSRPIPSQPYCLLTRAPCDCSVNSSIKHSILKESNSPSTEQTHTMKWPFLASENPCLTLSKIIAWLSKKY